MQMTDMHNNIKNNYSLKRLNRIRTGGCALYYVTVSTIDELNAALNFAREQRIPFYILGNGTNVLIGDDDFEGIVIKLGMDMTTIQFNTEEGTVTAGAGASLMKLGRMLAKKGYLGCAYMAVIPGSVGGAVRINAGTTNEGEIKDHFVSSFVLNPGTGEICNYSSDAMSFLYRESMLSRSKKIILSATFKLPETMEKAPGEALQFVNKLIDLRNKNQPRNPRNFGSTFKRPVSENSAGWYLEKVGMKGMRIGGAMVAEEHANWILNVDNAKSADVRELISIGQERVYSEFGIRLEREVIYLPEDIEQWDD